MSFSSIPISSQSAPVDEYVVLWTADKYKKLKKWHDGYLRYHTFNKRLMVYDHMMNKVCDKFLPEPEPIDIGDELVLDSHLVTIEDIKGRQSQDLRPLFEKTVDRRRERSMTDTPVRRVGAEGPSAQSPTPSLLRTIRSRPPSGDIHPVYPNSAPRPSPVESPIPPFIIPQKRNSHGTAAVKKIVYKPFNVPKLRDDEPTPVKDTFATPSRSPKRRRSLQNQTGAKEASDSDIELENVLPSGLDLAQNTFDDEEDLDMLELDLEGSDFAAKPKPKSKSKPRIRPNAPPPFKPPLPWQNRAKEKQNQTLDPVKATLAAPEPVSSAISSIKQASNQEEPTPPRLAQPKLHQTQKHRSPEPSSSPIKRKSLVAPDGSSQFNIPSPAKNPSPTKILPPSPTPEPEAFEDGETGPPRRLTLPSAKSRAKRRLLCGPSTRENGASSLISITRPVSTMSIINTFPNEVLPPVEPVFQGRKLSKKITVMNGVEPEAAKEGSTKLSHNKQVNKPKEINIKLEEEEEYARLAVPEPRDAASSANHNAGPVSGLGNEYLKKTQNIIVKPEPFDEILDMEISDYDEPIRSKSVVKTPPEPIIPPHMKDEQVPTNDLKIFSSDEEPEYPNAKRPVKKVNGVKKLAKKATKLKSQKRGWASKSSPDSTSSSDEFESLRLSALPKQLVEESRNTKLVRQNQISEASRVWKENND
ncbi:hypothetical protein ABW20_dc0100374 [Dactylellina cionopaga]|nr:hypothetical protein ABW20_dc0100374 [Dactylellina cionopaga]